MKKSLLPLFLLPAVAGGQASFGHLDSIELGKIKAAHARAAAMNGDVQDDSLTFFVRVADDDAVARVEAAGATIDQREGNILVVTSPLGLAETVAAAEGVVTVSLPRQLNTHEWTSPYGFDKSRSVLGLDRIRAAETPLKQAYTGEGVIVAVIDMGIDVHHINFLNPDGTHRVKCAWKHVMDGKASLMQTADTEEKVAKFTTDNYAGTHGTHVMGIAAGSFTAPAGEGPDVCGAAPGADIAVSAGATMTSQLVKSIRTIANYAAAQDKPCVVNISMGNNDGPHDGTDEFPAALNEVAAQEGISIFVSSGNEGNSSAFLYHEFDGAATPLRSIINPSAYTAALFPNSFSMFPQACGTMEIWGDDATPFSVWLDVVSFGANGPEVLSSFEIGANSSGYLCNEGMKPGKVDVVNDTDAAFNAAYRSSFIGGAGKVYAANNRYHVEMAMQLECPDATAHQKYRMALRIEGAEGKKVYVYGGATGGVFPFMFLGGFEGYKASDSNGSVNALAGADKVVTVGSYISHNMAGTRDKIGTTASYSSWGVTPDGRMHPMVSTPGSRIISSMSGDYANGPGYDPDQVKYYSYEAPDGKTYHWTPMTGTSMASPYMTGIAAVWLSADPTLTTADIVRIAQETADTPSAPCANDGMGAHVNAFEGLCKVLGLSGVKDVSVKDTPYTLLRSGNTFTIQAPAAARIEARVYNMQGSGVLAAVSGSEELTVDCSGLAPGIYVLGIDAQGNLSSEIIVIK